MPYFVELANTRLVGFPDYQDHSRSQGCDIPVVMFQGGDRSVIRSGYRVQGLALLHLVMLHGGLLGGVVRRTGGGAARPGRTLRSAGMPARYLRLARAPRYW